MLSKFVTYLCNESNSHQKNPGMLCVLAWRSVEGGGINTCLELIGDFNNSLGIHAAMYKCYRIKKNRGRGTKAGNTVVITTFASFTTIGCFACHVIAHILIRRFRIHHHAMCFRLVIAGIHLERSKYNRGLR